VRPKEDYELRSGNGTDEQKWFIPVTYTTGQESRFDDTKPRLFMEPGKEEVTIQNIAAENDYILMNIQAVGE